MMEIFKSRMDVEMILEKCTISIFLLVVAAGQHSSIIYRFFDVLCCLR